MDKWEELVWWLESHIEIEKAHRKMYKGDPDLWKGYRALVRGTINRESAFKLTLEKVKRLEESGTNHRHITGEEKKDVCESKLHHQESP